MKFADAQLSQEELRSIKGGYIAPISDDSASGGGSAYYNMTCTCVAQNGPLSYYQAVWDVQVSFSNCYTSSAARQYCQYHTNGNICVSSIGGSTC